KVDIEKIESIKIEQKTLGEKAVVLENNIATVQQQTGQIQARLDSALKLQSEVDAKKANIDSLRLVYNLRKQVEKSLGKQGIQAIIIENSLSFFEVTSRSFLKRFTG